MRNGTIARYLDMLRSSYWFIPTVMAFGAVGLAVVTTLLEGLFRQFASSGAPWLFYNQPDGARALLSTIAGSMITVAGVTFTITIAAVSYVSGKFGPRILTQFMRDRGNQWTLGTFISTFLYCLLVLRTVQSETGENRAGEPESFVPHLGMLCGLGLGILSVAVLIYFLHHVPESIHISNIVGQIGKNVVKLVENDRFEDAGEGLEGMPEGSPTMEEMEHRGLAIRADGSGYIDHIDTSGLLRHAVHSDSILVLRCRPGDFVSDGQPLALLWPPEHDDRGLHLEVRRRFFWGNQRTPTQDLAFLIRELTDIAGRALSPGINDPSTASDCLDWLGNMLALMATCPPPIPYRGCDGHLRLILHPIDFEEAVDLVFGPLRPYVSADRNAALHTFKILANLATGDLDVGQRKILRREADLLLAACEANMNVDHDRVEARERYRIVLQVLDGDIKPRAARGRYQWIGGTA